MIQKLRKSNHKRWIACLMMAAELLHWTYQAISSSAFNLSMQVLRFLTFIPCSSLLPLSASDSYRVELSACVRWKMHFVYECALVCFKCTAFCVLNLWMMQSHSGLVWETRFDTNIVKITCVQTVIALQTIRTTITHF